MAFEECRKVMPASGGGKPCRLPKGHDVPCDHDHACAPRDDGWCSTHGWWHLGPPKCQAGKPGEPLWCSAAVVPGTVYCPAHTVVPTRARPRVSFDLSEEPIAAMGPALAAGVKAIGESARAGFASLAGVLGPGRCGIAGPHGEPCNEAERHRRGGVPCTWEPDLETQVACLRREVDLLQHATRIALEKSTTAIATACQPPVGGRAAPAIDVEAAVVQATAIVRERDALRMDLAKVRDSLETAMHERDLLDQQVDRLAAERDAARKESAELVTRAGLAEAKVSIGGANAGRAFEREAALRDRLLEALQARDAAREEAKIVVERVSELEVKFAEEQDANDAEEAETKAARDGLLVARRALELVDGALDQFIPRTVEGHAPEDMRGFPRTLDPAERVSRLGRERNELLGEVRSLRPKASGLAADVEAVAAERNKARDEIERLRADLARAMASRVPDPEAAESLHREVMNLRAERDSMAIELNDLVRETPGKQPPALGRRAGVTRETADLARVMQGGPVVLPDSVRSTTTYGRAARMIEMLGDEVVKLRKEGAQARELADKYCRESAQAGTNLARAESRAADATRRAEVALATFQASEGARLIAAERERQVTREGFTSEHDDGHRDESMAWAAACYAAPARVYRLKDGPEHPGAEPVYVEAFPWDAKWDKRPLDPADPAGFEHHAARRRALVKAGALCAAEVDRLDRSLPF